MRCKAAEELAKEGIEAEVIDLRTLRPMERDAIVDIREARPPLRDGRRRLAAIRHRRRNRRAYDGQAFDDLDAPVLRVTGSDVPMPYAANLEKLALPSVADVIEAAKAVCYKS